MAFIRAVNFTLSHEGGYVNNPNDGGGETNFGISKRANPNVDIKNLTRDDAMAIYLRDYWEPAHCDAMPEAVGIAHFDCAVHSGIRRAALLLQVTVDTPRDGVIGLETLSALEVALRKRGLLGVARDLIRARIRFLVKLERQNNRWDFLEGFMVRCSDLMSEVSQLAGATVLPPR